MRYQSTRNGSLTATSLEAVLKGMASDGGLFLPSDIGKANFDWKCTLGADTRSIATSVMSALLPDFENMKELVEKAYLNKFETEDLTPVVKVGNHFVLELFRGPTSAFKDVALSMLPQLICAAKKQTGDTDTTLILTATSGDTGKAALEGFHDISGIRIIVFYPEGAVSAVQRLQMVTQVGDNVRVCAVRGNFDDAQTGVKKAFAVVREKDLLAGRNTSLSSANSINIGRLAPQLTYYFKAYSDLVASGAVAVGETVDFCVPTGNFGDILAGYFAKALGLPVGHLVCASNANNVLWDFLTTGTYNRKRPFLKTTSPSMDILVSSNLERMLFLACGDSEQVAGWMRDLNEKGSYTVTPSVLSKLKETFWAGYASDEAAAASIKKLWNEHNYLCDTHTAVAWNVAEQYQSATGSNRPMVVLSTASPYKFPTSVLSAITDGKNIPADEFEVMEKLTNLTGVPVPNGLSGLNRRPILHTDIIDPSDILDYVLK